MISNRCINNEEWINNDKMMSEWKNKKSILHEKNKDNVMKNRNQE